MYQLRMKFLPKHNTPTLVHHKIFTTFGLLEHPLTNKHKDQTTQTTKNFTLKHMILYIYCIELVRRIPKHIHFPFYDFFTIYYEFLSIQSITEINKTPKKEKGSLGPKRPSAT